MKLLLKHGARINSREKDGISALHNTCYRGHTETVKELLKHGCDISHFMTFWQKEQDC